MPPWAGTRTAPTEPTAAAPPVTPDTGSGNDPPTQPLVPNVPTDGQSSSSSNKPSGKKAGKQIGAKGFGRTQKLIITDVALNWPPTGGCDYISRLAHAPLTGAQAGAPLWLWVFVTQYQTS